MKLKIMLSIVAVLLLSIISVAAVDFTVDPTTIPQQGEPGDEVTFTVTVNSTEDLTVKFDDFNLEKGEDNLIISSQELDVEANVSGSLTISFDVPAKLYGEYKGDLVLYEDGNTTNKKEINLTLTIEEKVQYELSETNVVFSVTPDTEESLTLEITNTGSVPLENIELVYNDEDGDFDDNIHEDSYGDKLTFSYPDLDTLGSIGPGEKKEVDLNVKADRYFEVGDYFGVITVSLNNDTIHNKQIEVETEVWPQICRYGVVGEDLKVDIKEPRNGDYFKPGEEIEIEVVVDNRGNDRLDVVVEAMLYNLDSNKELEEVTETKRIRDKEDEEFELTLTVPTDDWDEKDTYYLYVKAYEEDEEDEQCEFEKIEIDLERDKDDILVTEFTITPETVKAGEKISLFAEVKNIGTYDHEDVYVTFKNTALGLDLVSSEFDLGAYDDSDNVDVFEAYFDVPKDTAAGDYYIEAIVTFDDGDMTSSKMLKLVVEAGEAEEEQGAVDGLVIEVSDSIDLEEGQTKFTLPLLLSYEGESFVEFTIDITEASGWLNVLRIDSPSKLYPGDKFHSYAYLELKEDIVSGPHNFRVNARSENGLIVSELVTINVPERDVVDESDVDDSKFKEFFTNKTNIFWLIGDLVLVVIAIFFIRMLFKKH